MHDDPATFPRTPWGATSGALLNGNWYVDVRYSVSADEIREIWETATLACGYWASDMTGAHGDPGAYYIREREPSRDDYDYALTSRDIAQAIGTIIGGHVAISRSIRRDIIDGDYDGEAADAIIQVACFGEITYG